MSLQRPQTESKILKPENGVKISDAVLRQASFFVNQIKTRPGSVIIKNSFRLQCPVYKLKRITGKFSTNQMLRLDSSTGFISNQSHAQV